MCGRYVITKPVTKTTDLVKTNIKVENLDNYNAHPGQTLPIIKAYTNGRALESLEWGLKPEWAKNKKDFRPLINARLETLMEKLSFKNLIKTSKCIVIADGYYEWKKEGTSKSPYYFTREDKDLMFFAGIYEKKQFCIITKEAQDNVKEVHNREPVIINQSQLINYLNVKKDGYELLQSLKPPKLSYHPISKDVNNPTNNDPVLINKV